MTKIPYNDYADDLEPDPLDELSTTDFIGIRGDYVETLVAEVEKRTQEMVEYEAALEDYYYGRWYEEDLYLGECMEDDYEDEPEHITEEDYILPRWDEIGPGDLDDNNFRGNGIFLSPRPHSHYIQSLIVEADKRQQEGAQPSPQWRWGLDDA